MKKNYTLLFLLFVSVFAYSQCLGTFEYITINSDNDGNVQIMDDCNWSGDYNNILDLIIGEDYVFTSEIATDYFTFTDDSNNILASGPSPLTITSVTVASGRIHIYYDLTCIADDVCRETTIQCASCTPPPAPDCASDPTPGIGASGVPYGTSTFSWLAPTTGPTPTSYNIYGGETPSGDDYGLLDSVETTSVDLTITAYNFQLYWIVVPVNGTTEAVGCPVWSFTTELPPPPPPNDDCANAQNIVPSMTGSEVWTLGTTVVNTASGETPDPSCSDFGDGRDVWYTTTVPNTGQLIIETRSVSGSNLLDTGLTAYTGSCGAFTELECDDDDSPDGFFSLLSFTGLTPGQTLYLRVFEYFNEVNENADDGEFEISAHATNPQLSIEDFDDNQLLTYYPNPVKNILVLRAQNNIGNISVFNMLGQEVLRNKPNAFEINLNMSSLQTGAYFVKVTINDIIKTIRVIKQ